LKRGSGFSYFNGVFLSCYGDVPGTTPLRGEYIISFILPLLAKQSFMLLNIEPVGVRTELGLFKLLGE
jgi:hypothetical protein